MAKKSKKTGVEPVACYVYLGPSIRGVVMNAAIYVGTFSEVCDKLSEAIERYPEIRKLIVASGKVAEVSEKIKIGGNLYAAAYRALAKSTN